MKNNHELSEQVDTVIAHKEVKKEKPDRAISDFNYSSPTEKHYDSVCWNCKETVDSDLNPRCPNCGWYICSCGACGCDYNKI